jgi:hypothetical protein
LTSFTGCHGQDWMAAQSALLALSGIPGVVIWYREGLPSLPTANLTVTTMPATYWKSLVA